MIIRSFPLLVILVLFVSAFTMPLIKKKNVIQAISLLVMSISLILSIIAAIYVINEGKFFYRIGHFDAPIGIEFYIGNIEVIMGILFTFVSLMVIWYSIYSIHKEIDEARIGLYYLLINILIGALLGVIYTNDLLIALYLLK